MSLGLVIASSSLFGSELKVYYLAIFFDKIFFFNVQHALTLLEKHRYKKHLPTSITTQMTTQTTWQPLDSSFIMMNAIE